MLIIYLNNSFRDSSLIYFNNLICKDWLVNFWYGEQRNVSFVSNFESGYFFINLWSYYSWSINILWSWFNWNISNTFDNNLFNWFICNWSILFSINYNNWSYEFFWLLYWFFINKCCVMFFWNYCYWNVCQISYFKSINFTCNIWFNCSFYFAGIISLMSWYISNSINGNFLNIFISDWFVCISIYLNDNLWSWSFKYCRFKNWSVNSWNGY